MTVFFIVQEEETVKKLAFAALATIAIATPTIASAEEFGVRVGGDPTCIGTVGFAARALSSLMASMTVACIADGIAASVAAMTKW